MVQNDGMVNALYNQRAYFPANILLFDCILLVLELFQFMQFPVLFSYAGRRL